MKKISRYPVYVISKGRHDRCLTADFLLADGIPFRLVVEPTERKLYEERYGPECISILPFHDLGQGSIPARNWVWEHSMKAGHARHWILDDNIRCVRRMLHGKKIRCATGPAFAATEDFVDRYENIAIAGLTYTMFGYHFYPPFFKNAHVYSCLLVLNELPYRWRGRYNEDTDLCLQVLSGGWCTILMNAFTIDKMRTMMMKGGNSDELYRADGRTVMARSLERLWPGVVKTKRRFKRPQHVVKDAWRKFDTPLKRRIDIDWENLKPNEYGMRLEQIAEEIKSPELREMIDRQGGA